MIGDKENLWFLGILKHSILELILFERLQKEWELSSLEFKLLHVVAFSESCRDLQESTVKRCLLILDSNPFRPKGKGNHFISRKFQSLAVWGKKM